MDGIVAWWPRKGWKVRMRFSILASQRKTISRFRAHFPVQCVQFGSWLLTTSQGKVIGTLASGGALAANKGFFFVGICGKVFIYEWMLSQEHCFTSSPKGSSYWEANPREPWGEQDSAGGLGIQHRFVSFRPQVMKAKWKRAVFYVSSTLLHPLEGLYLLYRRISFFDFNPFVLGGIRFVHSWSEILRWNVGKFLHSFFFTCVGCGETSWMDLNCFFVTWQANWMPDRTLLYVSGCMILACLNYLINYLSWLFG